MTILQVTTDTAGRVGVIPRRVEILSTDDLDTVTAAGYLNNTNTFGLGIQPTDIIDMIYLYNKSTGIGTYGEFFPEFSDGIITLVLEPGTIVGDVTAGNFAFFTAGGELEDLGIAPSDPTKTIVASVGDTPVISEIAYFSDIIGTISATGTGVISHHGDIQAGGNGSAGSFISYPVTSNTGSLKIQALANTGNYEVKINNDMFGQASTLRIPDPQAASAKFLLDTGPDNIITDYQQMIGIEDIIGQTAGTWTVTRVATANWNLAKTAAADTSITAFDITPQLRAAASKGFRLASIDAIYGIATLALTAHTATLSSVVCANNVAVAVTSAPLTGSLSTATQANPYVTNLSVATPAFLNTAVAKYVFELTVNAQATSDYFLYGINLHFSKTVS